MFHKPIPKRSIFKLIQYEDYSVLTRIEKYRYRPITIALTFSTIHTVQYVVI